MSLVVAFFGATAALAAATFSGLALYLSGQREERKWRRETLTNAYQDFIRISFDRSYSAVQAMLARDAAESTSIEAFRLREADLHAQHESLLTRLKLLAPHEVVKAAQHLHESDHSLVDPALKTANAASGEDWTSFEANRKRNGQAKDQMLNAARATLGLEPTEAVGSAWRTDVGSSRRRDT